jgi:hypothetical protein
MSSAGHIFEMIRRIRANKLEKKRFGRFKSQKKWDNTGTVKDHNSFKQRNENPLYILKVRKIMMRQKRREMVLAIVILLMVVVAILLIVPDFFS